MATFLPILQLFGNDGKVLANGKIYAYAAGTTTPQVAYTDAGGGTPLENPIQLDAAGRPKTSGSIWLSGNYDLYIEDSSGNLVHSPIGNTQWVSPIDWTALTATITQINSLSIPAGTAGTVYPGHLSVVDASKNISTYNNLTSGTLISNTSLQTPAIMDANGVAAVTIPTVSQQVNAITVTPDITTASPTLAATGSDTNIGLSFSSKGTSPLKLNTFTWPTTDGVNHQAIGTNGSAVLSFASPNKLDIQSNGTNATGALVLATTGFYANSAPAAASLTFIKSVNITPTTPGSKLYFEVNAHAGANSTGVGKGGCLAIYDSTNLTSPIAMSANVCLSSSTDTANISFEHVVTISSTTAKTYSLYGGSTNSSILGYLNQSGTSGAAGFGGVSECTMTIIEVVP